MKTIANLIRGAALAAVALTTFTVPSIAQYSSPMHDVDNGARQPVQFQILLNGTDGSPSLGTNNAYQVPSGKRLVIEQITGRAGLPSPEIIEGKLTLTAAGLTIQHFLRFDPPLPLNDASEYYTTLPVRFYADPGTFVGIGVARFPTTGIWAATITVSGYLVNLP